MKDVEIIKLQRRVSHLERKLVIWASRMKKEVIWRKYMEDWVMTKFNFDLRLQVELKTLEEDGVDEFEKDEANRQPSSSLNINKNSPRPSQAQQPSSLARPFTKNQNLMARSSVTFTNRSTSASNSLNRIQSFSTPTSTNPRNLQPMRPTIQSSVTISPQPLPGQTSGPVRPTVEMATDRSNASGSDRNSLDTLQAKRRKIIHPPQNVRPSAALTNPVIISTTSMAIPPKSPEVIVLDQEDNNSNSSSSSRNQPTSSSAGSRSSSNPIVNSSRETTVQQLDSFVRNISSDGGNGLPDSRALAEYPDSSCGNELDYSQYEGYYCSSGYMTRTMTSVEFNVRKILLEYGPECTEAMLDEMRVTRTMSLTMKKNITCGVCDFLMQVYTENPPRFARDCMATSLFNFFPYVAKETWWCRQPLKNPTGHLEHRINNRRRQLLEERRKIANQQDEGHVDSILGLS